MDEVQAGNGSARKIVRIVIVAVVVIILVNVAVNVIGGMRGHDDEQAGVEDKLAKARAKVDAAPLPQGIKRSIQDAIQKAARQGG